MKGKINYSEDAKTVRWPRILKELKALPIGERRRLLLKATSYRSGENDIGSVYMGGMAHASLRHVFGAEYGDSKTYLDLIREADEATLDKALMVAMHTIEYMLAYPMERCKCCGQIIPADS